MPLTCGRISATRYAEVRPESSVVTSSCSGFTVKTLTSAGGGPACSSPLSHPARPTAATRNSAKLTITPPRILAPIKLAKESRPGALRRGNKRNGEGNHYRDGGKRNVYYIT